VSSDSPSFRDLGVPEELIDGLKRAGIGEPFPVQAATIPDAMSGRDLSGRAPTGSGKTLAFALPTLTRITKATAHHPTALVLVPTRELALQVQKAMVPLARVVHRYVLAVYGGTGMREQIDWLRRGADVVVATPGRLQDLLRQGALRLDKIEVVVIDEADRLADMGFLPEVRSILDLTPRTRQTLLFSATLDGDVDTLVRDYQRDPVRHDLAGAVDEQTPDAEHLFWTVPKLERLGIAAKLVKAHGQTVVFTRTRHGADRLARQLDDAGVSSVAIHGDRTQPQRERALESFRSGRALALVATDVAARGIHVDGVRLVIHWDLPADSKDYVHRSGRTARAGESGVVASLVAPEQRREARTIIRNAGLETEVTAPDHGRLTPIDLPPVAAPLPVRADAPAKKQPPKRLRKKPGYGQARDYTATTGDRRDRDQRPAGRTDERPASARGDQRPAGRTDRPTTRTDARPGARADQRPAKARTDQRPGQPGRRVHRTASVVGDSPAAFDGRSSRPAPRGKRAALKAQAARRRP
jgi:superfamily II DNA/RNA helicase